MEQPQSGCGGAAAVLNLHPGFSMSVTYHPSFGPHDDLILLELDEKLLQDVIHERVTIRGRPDEDAVLCTQSKTYAIKYAGNSNSVFLVPPSDLPAFNESSEFCNGKDHGRQVIAPILKVAPGNMELVEVAPRLDKLRLLLLENTYSSSDEVLEFDEDLDRLTDNKKTGLYTWDDLIDKVQASDDEIKTGLRVLSAVEIDGYWRIVDEKYMNTILHMLLHNSVLNDWSLDSLDEDEVVRVLVSDGFPHKLAHHCLDVYGGRVDGGEGSWWRLDERSVCVHFARQILKEGKNKMEGFMEEWKRKVPEGMEASFEMLEGEVLTEKLGVESWVRLFSVSQLPSTPAERFSILFRERPKWDWKDLLPYIRDLRVPGLSMEGLLLKYTRRTQPTPEAEPVFSAR